MTVNGESLESKSRALEEEPNRNVEVQIHAEVLRMKADEKKALGSSKSASGDAELVSEVLVTVNGESLESKSRALEEEPHRNVEIQIHAEVLRMKAEETN